MARPKKIVTTASLTQQGDEIPMVTSEILLSADEQMKLEAEAAAEFEAEQKAAQAAAFKKAVKSRLQKKALFSDGEDDAEGAETVTIDLAPHAPYVALDGRRFYHGMTYNLSPAQAATINEAVHRSWMHEREIGGANVNAMAGRSPRNLSLSPNKGS